MEKLNDRNFIKLVESLINPMEISGLLVFQRFKKLLPPAIFRKMLHRAAKKTPRIGFVIEPYSLFLFFKLKDIETAKSLLPERYELEKTNIFADDEPEYYLGIGNLSTRASTFWGVRQESYLIARDKQTGLPSWLFLDILSNTVIAAPSKGIVNPNSTDAVFTTNSHGEVFLDIGEDKNGRKLSLTGSLRNGKTRKLDEPLWVMGNTSIGHVRRYVKGEDRPFAVIFDPAEVAEAWDIPVEDIRIEKNTLFPGLAEAELAKVACFPFAQHYIADSPGISTSVKDTADMISKYKELAEVDKMKTFSASTILRQFGITFAIFTAIVIALVLIF